MHMQPTSQHGHAWPEIHAWIVCAVGDGWHASTWLQWDTRRIGTETLSEGLGTKATAFYALLVGDCNALLQAFVRCVFWLHVL
jgi:hypothetical protein